MSYKIVRKADAYPYEAPKHYNMLATRLHNPQDVNDGVLTVGLTTSCPAAAASSATTPWSPSTTSSPAS